MIQAVHPTGNIVSAKRLVRFEMWGSTHVRKTRENNFYCDWDGPSGSITKFKKYDGTLKFLKKFYRKSDVCRFAFKLFFEILSLS